MNIFALSDSPILSAQWQHDRHVVKMILESCQMLSTACKTDGPINDIWESESLPWGSSLYKITHANHPCTLWVRENPANFVWLTIHLSTLIDEYHLRFPGKTHKCEKLLWSFAALCGKIIDSGFYTKNQINGKRTISFAAIQFAAQHEMFVYCGPDQYYHANHTATIPAVCAYRNYYLAEKCKGNRWTRHSNMHLPDWLAPYATIHQRPANPASVKAKRLFSLVHDKPSDSANPSRVKMPAIFGGKSN